jgi:hypothetical protein
MATILEIPPDVKAGDDEFMRILNERIREINDALNQQNPAAPQRMLRISTGGAGNGFYRYVFGLGVAGDISVETSATPKNTSELKVQLARWRITANVAPVGASIVVDLMRNGVSIFPTGFANKIVLASGQLKNKGTVFLTTPLIMAYEDELLPDVLQVGSTTPGFRIQIQVTGMIV